MTNQPSYKRWYDRQPKLSQAVRALTLFPDAIKNIVSEGLILLANREFDVNEQMNSFRTLGTDKVLGLYKSKNKRRDYDHNDLLHKTMNYLYILSESNQDVMADHILQLTQYIQTYLSTCQAFQATPTMEDLAQLTSTYVEKGTAEVEAFLNALRQEFYEKMLTDDDRVPPIDFMDDILEDDELGMKIKRLE